MLNEPSVIALNKKSGDVLAMGHEAWQMIGRTPSYIVAVRPLRKGAITDFDVTQRMIRLLLQRVGVSRFNRPRVVICVPSAITAVERRAVTEAARRAGAAEPGTVAGHADDGKPAPDGNVRLVQHELLVVEGMHLHVARRACRQFRVAVQGEGQQAARLRPVFPAHV